MEVVPHGNEIYPWEKWSNGQWHKVRRGRGFNCKTESFRQLVSKTARQRGWQCVTRVLPGDVVAFQILRNVGASNFQQIPKVDSN